MVQCFSLTTNQPTILSTMAYQPSEQGDGFRVGQTFLCLMRFIENIVNISISK
jgi:hypothetical protein